MIMTSLGHVIMHSSCYGFSDDVVLDYITDSVVLIEIATNL